MSIGEKITSHPPRERAGSLAANRFGYQLDWALCRLLELHAEGKDYVVVIDLHDDVLVLDSATNPQSVICYQIKTKDAGSWSRANLLHRKKGKDGPLASILGKLYRHVIDFAPDPVERLYFVSNAPLKLKASATTYTDEKHDVDFDKVASDEREVIQDALAGECVPPAGLTIELSKLRYKRAPLPVNGHAETALARLVLFLEAIPEAHSVRGPAFYRTLKQELERAFHFEGSPKDFADMCACKAVTRQRFVKMLAEACSTPRPGDYGDQIAHRLNVERVSVPTVASVQRMVRRFAVERLNPSDRLLADQVSQIRATMRSFAPTDSLWQDIEAIRTTAACQGTGMERVRGADYVRAVIGVLLHEPDELPSVD
jgi:hypothetical protein